MVQLLILLRFSSGLHCNLKLLNPNLIQFRFGLAFGRGPPGQTQMEYLQLCIIWGKDGRQNHLRMLSARTGFMFQFKGEFLVWRPSWIGGHLGLAAILD